MSDTEKRIFVENGGTSQEPSAEPDSASPPESNNGFKTARFDDGDVIFEEGEPGNACYLILRGNVEIRKGVMSSSPQTLATLSRSDIFGEMALFDNSPRMAEAVARSHVELIAIDRDEFNRRLDTIDPVIKSISVYLVGRVRSMADEFAHRKDPTWGE